MWKGETCSFCGRRPHQIDQMFPTRTRTARVCDVCLSSFSSVLAADRANKKAAQDRLLGPVCWGEFVRLTIRSRFLVLLDPLALDLHRKALQVMSVLNEDERREN